ADKIKSKTSSPSAVPITGSTTRKHPIEVSWHPNSKREIGADIHQGVGPDFPQLMELLRRLRAPEVYTQNG
ncbi:MAG: hypothetical protein JWQ35_94, partial [Bacteriovoracaceae bacterium]|nr:hypothetical protein [Bacteriovoracaceae bacterium]